MSNELVYGDPSVFVNKLQAAEAEAREFFDSVVTYLSACAKSLSAYREGLPADDTTAAEAWALHIESGPGLFKLSSPFAGLTLLRSHPLGTIRYQCTERFATDSDFYPRCIEGFLDFTGKSAESEKSEKNSSVAIFSSEGTLPSSCKTDSPASFAEPLFAQLFAPLPVESVRTNKVEAT
jgi:hypothetical protein